MELGESKISNPIISNKRWNKTGVDLKKGMVYSINVLPKDNIWYDVDISGLIVKSCSAEGFSGSLLLKFFAWSKRMPNKKWLSLIGCIDERKDSFFHIGKGVESYSAPIDGELICFGNDTKGFYKNNRGEMIIKVERIE